MKTIRTIIIDDERSARQEIIRMLHAHPQFVVLAEAANAQEASPLIEMLKPDLIFLDVQMPGLTGFEMLETLEHMPQVIFVTAFDDYAIKAFEVNALDYLLKPVRHERFEKAIERAAENSIHLIGTSIFVKDKENFRFIKWTDIHLIDSLDNYARLHCAGKFYLIKKSLNQLESNPDCRDFFRANRSQLFNLGYIDKVIKDKKTLTVLLRTGDEIVFSERQTVNFKKQYKDI